MIIKTCPRCEGDRGHTLPEGTWKECEYCQGDGVVSRTAPAAVDANGFPYCHSVDGTDCYYLLSHVPCPLNTLCTTQKFIYTEGV